MIFSVSLRRKIAIMLLVIWVANLCNVPIAYALTSGPSQPETQSFQPAGVSDMVDLTSGDFKYNIPLLDIEGYPINLNYQSGSGMDDEASWVGLGWNMNVGAINRQLRGIADDFSGDKVITEHYTKPKVTIGGKFTAKVEVKGRGIVKGKGSLTLGIFSDNYTGIGAEIGANAGISVSLINDGALTAGLGLGVLSSTASGAGYDVSPYINMSISGQSTNKLLANGGLSTSMGYNSRSGTKDLTLGASFNASKQLKNIGLGGGLDLSTSAISYNTEPINPTIQIPYRSTFGSFSFDGGASLAVVFLGGGFTGYKSVKTVAKSRIENEGYGFMYAERAKGKGNIVMDFIREKDNPIIPELPALAMPIHMPDLFSYTNQSGSGQFRLHRSTGAFGDATVDEESRVSTGGFDAGFGIGWHAGGTFFEQTSKTKSSKWTQENNYLAAGDFQNPSSNPKYEHVYFKMVGEKGLEDESLSNKLQGTSALGVNLSGRTSFASFHNKQGQNSDTEPLINDARQARKSIVTYLTAMEASKVGHEKRIKSYPLNDSASFQLPESFSIHANDSVERDSEYRKKHHISEITVTDDGGQRMVYGIPVYNIEQQEISFAIGTEQVPGAITPDYETKDGNQVQYPVIGGILNYKKGIDHYYHKEIQPAYASSFLLTEILSPDYVDKTNDGVSPDDNGTAIKFHYTKVSNSYRWRTPYGSDRATVNKGLLADPDDDKASIIVGKKELWYTHSIESKTQIAYFILTDRVDGLGVTDWRGGRDLVNRQKRLSEIRLYSKADMKRPIKVVKFGYDYSLCPETPNSLKVNNPTDSNYNPGGGKLTLRKVWFEYGNTVKGKSHPYTFTYNKKANSGNEVVAYSNLCTDRWGTYKLSSENKGLMKNDVYPYTTQDSALVAKNASLWNISTITLPTGGKIEVVYESDDYAFVQNKRSMEMVDFDLLNAGGEIISLGSSSALKETRGVRVNINSEIPATITSNAEALTKWFKNNYLNGSDYLYTKLFVKLSTGYSKSKGQDFDYVPCYAKIANVLPDGEYVKVMFENITEGSVTSNPIAIAAWQRQKNEYPRYAYRGFENRANDGSANLSAERAINAIFSSIQGIKELSQSFYEKASELNFASQVNLSKSFVRITKANGKKIGGGARVKTIRISDEWANMSGAPSFSNTYGQSYEYTTKQNGKLISSGVASYEPFVGADENPMRQPVPYIQKIRGAINNYFSLEEPFGESLFPGANVVYSKVTVRDLDRSGDATPLPETGYIVNEFYTAKDFPVITSVMPIKRSPQSNPAKRFSFLSGSSYDVQCLAQGYSIELNDMHGKPKANRVYNKTGSEISSTEFFYNTSNAGAGEFRLRNTVNVVNEKGVLRKGVVIGRDIDFFTDAREQESTNTGFSVQFGVDVVPLVFITLPIPHFPKYDNNDYKLFRSLCALKVSQYYGVVQRVVKRENGSSISTENVAYDSLTGEALITKTQNEFKQDIYSVNLPAYWAYKGMGAAYQNLGVLFQGLNTDVSGVITNTSYLDYISPGDEIADLGTGKCYWAVETGGYKRLIDSKGAIQQVNLPFSKIIRSGYRNLLQPATSTLVCMGNPIEGDEFKLKLGGDLSSLKVVNASNVLYDSNWAENIEILQEEPVYSYEGAYLEYPVEVNLFNPYLKGYLGNWRIYRTNVYEEGREYNNLFGSDSKGVNVKSAGYYHTFNLWWKVQDDKWIENSHSKWVTSNTVTLYNKYGQELENKDALGRYNSALFDFNGKMPAAIASNAMNREIYVNGFEDNLFRKANPSQESPYQFINLSTQSSLYNSAVSSESHSGNYSVVLPLEGIQLLSSVHERTHKTEPYFTFTAKNEYKLLNYPGLYPNGFQPKSGSKYVFNAWIKDSHPNDRSLDIQYSFNDGSPQNFKCKAIVEGWKLIEGIFTTGGYNSGAEFNILNTVSGIYIDDIRIHPLGAQLKSYAYNDKTFKLMAELDENAFATFYEYDDEGSLVRVKKETERGIVTLKESRSSYRRQ